MSQALEVAVQALKDISQGSGRVRVTDDMLSSREAFRASFGSVLQSRAREALLESLGAHRPTGAGPDPERHLPGPQLFALPGRPRAVEVPDAGPPWQLRAPTREERLIPLTDLRLEAAAKAYAATADKQHYPWQHWLAHVREIAAVHDALRAFDQDQPAESAERKPLPRKHMSAESAASMAIHDLGRDLNKIPLGVIATAAVTAWRKWEDNNATHPCRGTGDCVGHPHDCYDHPRNCGCTKAAAREEVMPHKPGPVHYEGPNNATAPVMGADPPWFKEQAETIMHDAHEACGVYHTTAKSQIIRALHRAFEYGKRFVSDQLPLPGFVSAAAKEAGETGRLADAPWIKQLAMEIRDEHFENLSTFCVETIIIKALRFANAQPPSSDRVMTALSVYLQHLGHYSTVVDPAGIEAMRAALIAAAMVQGA